MINWNELQVGSGRNLSFRSSCEDTYIFTETDHSRFVSTQYDFWFESTTSEIETEIIVAKSLRTNLFIRFCLLN